MSARPQANLSRSDDHWAYRHAWLAVALGTVAAPTVLIAARMHIEFAALLPYLALLGALAGVHFFYLRWRPNPAISLITGSMALMMGAAFLAGIIANAGLRLRFALVDDALSRWDLAIGIDTPALVLGVAARPWLAELLGLAYVSIFPLSFVTAVWLGLRGAAQRLWEFVLAFAAGLVVAAIISVFVPALGNIANAGLHALAGNQLPAGSGVYFLEAVHKYRDGVDPVLAVAKLEGVVCFPSFHIIMALAVAYAHRGQGAATWLIAAWCVLVGFSTIPNGGHYVVDLIAGTGLWAATLALPVLSRSGLFALGRWRSPASRLG